MTVNILCNRRTFICIRSFFFSVALFILSVDVSMCRFLLSAVHQLLNLMMILRGLVPYTSRSP